MLETRLPEIGLKHFTWRSSWESFRIHLIKIGESKFFCNADAIRSVVRVYYRKTVVIVVSRKKEIKEYLSSRRDQDLDGDLITHQTAL